MEYGEGVELDGEEWKWKNEKKKKKVVERWKEVKLTREC